MEKKRYELKIADVDMAIISDEKEDFVNKIANELDTNIKSLLLHSRRCSKLDAAILCALEYASDKTKAEKRVRNLEAQVTLYDANIRRLREENARLRGDIFVCPPAKSEEKAEEVSEDEAELRALDGADEAELEAETAAETKEDEVAVQLSLEDATDDESAKEDKIRRVEELLKNRREGEGAKDEKREDKLRQIENLLRGKEN